MAKAMGGDVVMQMLREFREMQEEARVQYERTDTAMRVVNAKTDVLFERTQVLFERSKVYAEQARVFTENIGELFGHVGELTTQVSTLTQELGGVKRVQGKMFEQVGRTLNRLAEAQASDRQRIEALELQIEGTGKP
ncbi:hypothetical protein [Corallococcus terminator]|uniref:Uncharacterized protein n=1 Tax=Corallococcus terminator TaxID=2316733 RepID=A0A3A8IXR1_9BACT|nr:hypothetical protein [Corallococcus terminator]RKG88005.1 hypothetical protein D7V88_14980 [Corallococcus terminator]